MAVVEEGQDEEAGNSAPVLTAKEERALFPALLHQRSMLLPERGF